MELEKKDEIAAIQLLLERGYVVRAISKEDVDFLHPELEVTDAEWNMISARLNDLDEGYDVNGIANMNFLDVLEEIREEISVERSGVA